MTGPSLPYIHRFTDSEGFQYGIRAIRDSDKAALQNGLSELSKESLRFRFFEYKKEFSPKELRYLTEVDGVDHCALVVELIGKTGPQEGVGVARYVRSKSIPSQAEFAVTIKDFFQGRGIGTQLIRALISHAQKNNISKLMGEVDGYNQKMLSLLKKFPEFKLEKYSEKSRGSNSTYFLCGEI